MVRLFGAASWLPEMKRAIEIWRLGDEGVEEIVWLGVELRAEIEGARSPERIAALLARLDAVDARLTDLESAFSFTLGAGSRRVQRIIFGGAVGSGLLFFGIALLTAARWLARQRRAERLFRSLTEDAHDMVNLIDREGMLRYVSPAVERTLGWQAEELTDRSALELIHPDDVSSVATTIAHALAHPQEPARAEFRFRHRDGSWRTVESTGRVLPLAGGPPLLIVVSRDTTQRRELEARLREAQKMESLGRLAGGVAHDFNNLLTAILGSAELLRHELPEGSRQRAELDEIASSGERAARLTSQLLAFARRQPLALRVVDLGALVRGMEGLLRRLLRDGIELVFEAGPGPATVRAASEQLEQVVVNLVVNARDALEGAGRITIETARDGDTVQLAVSDTGAGMSEEVQRRAFEPFFTTKPPGQGTGLGLATCYGIVEQSGGTIAAESSPGRGTTVRIRLPYAEPEPEAAEAPAREARRAHSGTVLLVEDEPAVRRIATLALRRAGHRVLEATDAHEALRIAEAGAEEVDLLVTDVVMPGMGGRALAARLRERRPELPVLFVSGYTEDEALRREIEALRAAFLPKPFTPEKLRAKVEELLDDEKARKAE
jgi:PAS domain S-box-containing protein